MRGETKDQARFKKLLAKVDALREQLRTWTSERPNIDRELALYGAAFDEMLRVSRELVTVLVLGAPALLAAVSLVVLVVLLRAARR